MEGTRYEGLAIKRVTILTGVLLIISLVIAFARDDTHGLLSPLGLQDAAPPSAILDPGSLDFGDQVVGRWCRAKRITVTNLGEKPLYVDSVAVSGDDERNFSVVRETCTGAKIVPYRACTIDVTFGPTATVNFDAQLQLIDNAPDSPQTMKLEGDGINSSSVPPFGTL